MKDELDKIVRTRRSVRKYKKTNIPHDNVLLLGYVSDDQLATLYRKCSLFVFPSLHEGFGLPAGEAMACGVPVVSTDGGALPEVVGDSGLIVPTKDHKAISSAVRCLLKDEDLSIALGEKGMARIHKYFSWAVTGGEMLKLYRSIIKENQSGMTHVARNY